jgi:hypothetical protein
MRRADAAVKGVKRQFAVEFVMPLPDEIEGVAP